MTALVKAGAAPLTMSSKDIADLCQKNHADVKRSMTTLLAKSLITYQQSAEKSTGGRPSTLFLVNQRDSYVVVAQLSPEFTARLVDRWQELEKQAAKPAFNLPTNFREALLQLVDQVDAREKAEAALAVAAPKAAALDLIAEDSKDVNIRDTAKVLGMTQREFVNRCAERIGHACR